MPTFSALLSTAAHNTIFFEYVFCYDRPTLGTKSVDQLSNSFIFLRRPHASETKQNVGQLDIREIMKSPFLQHNNITIISYHLSESRSRSASFIFRGQSRRNLSKRDNQAGYYVEYRWGARSSGGPGYYPRVHSNRPF
jgi:hypothetical protein